MEYSHRLLIFLLSASFILASGAGAEIVDVGMNGYIVEPFTPNMDPGTPLEVVQAELWDFPPRTVLVLLLLSVSSFLGFPVELILYIKIYTILGYRRISQKSVLSNETRNRIYSCIGENPGIIFNDLVRSTGINRGNVAYHLKILKMTGKISVLETSGNPRYFENSRIYSGTEKTVLKYIRNDKDCRILRLFLEKPHLTRKDIGDHIGLTQSTVGWRMKRLSDDELIQVRREGRNVRYEINPEIRQYLEEYL